MAITVMYDAGAHISVNSLNQNLNQVGKSLEKISTGQKFNDANGNAASYAISEKMLEQIRSLYQDDQNVQNGSSMIKTAERGIDQIVNNLRTMKEKAIDAANDSNTDEDRATIQKEIDQRREVINDIALGTKYNGKILLDGRWKQQTGSTGSTGGTIDDAGAYIDGVTNLFGLSKGTMTKSGVMSWANNKIAYTSPANNYVPLNFGGSTASNFPEDMDQQGFSILCTVSSCPSFYGFVFDASKAIGESEIKGTANAPVYVVGIKGADTAQKISAALFQGLANATGQTGSDTITLNSNHQVTFKKDGNNYSFTQSYAFYVFEGYSAVYADPQATSSAATGGITSPLWIQHGTQSGQRVHLSINDMRSKALGIDKAEVTTIEKANSAISIIDNAIETALDEATTMGAYLQRLETAFANVVTMRENTQGAESTIRDADMAKEITEYTKYNILAQASQAMLAQSNQNSSFVLGMLQ